MPTLQETATTTNPHQAETSTVLATLLAGGCLPAFWHLAKATGFHTFLSSIWPFHMYMWRHNPDTSDIWAKFIPCEAYKKKKSLKKHDPSTFWASLSFSNTTRGHRQKLLVPNPALPRVDGPNSLRAEPFPLAFSMSTSVSSAARRTCVSLFHMAGAGGAGGANLMKKEI